MVAITESVPRLAPPGAGISSVERLVGGTILRLRRRFGTPTSNSTEFSRQRGLIADLCRGQTAEALGRRVLIPRLRGLEDSSRYWSVWMTLDHLRIVNAQIAWVIEDLTAGRVPGTPASIAGVKPSPDADASVVPAYESECDRFLSVVGGRTDLRTEARYAHPWFGPLDAAAWHTMAAMHMGIHRAQVARILSELRRRS